MKSLNIEVLKIYIRILHFSYFWKPSWFIQEVFLYFLTTSPFFGSFGLLLVWPQAPSLGEDIGHVIHGQS